MEHVGPHVEGFVEAIGPHGHDHELLEVDRVVGVLPTVEDVHHGHREDVRIGPPDVLVELQALGVGRRTGRRQRDSQDGVGP